MKRLNHKKNLYKSIILLVILAIGIGYAYLTSNLSITGATEVVANTWDIHFENLNVTTGSVTTSSPATIDSNETSINYSITLSRPKDYYEFTVDVVNEGTLPGKVSISSLSGLDATSSKVVDYSVKYTYDMPVQVNDILNGGDTKSIKVRVYYKDDIEPEDFPDNNLNLNLTYSLEFNQSEKDEIVTGSLLQNLSSSNSCIKKYEGQVTDRVGVTETATNVYFNKCVDKRNIIFGGFCWQAIRTTENGGLKLIYNGEPVDGKCESTREDHIGIVGSSRNSQSLDSPYLYGNSFISDNTNGSFTLTDTVTATWSDSTYENILGKYTCKNTTGTCTTVYNISGYSNDTTAYVTSYTIGNTNYAQIGTSLYNDNYRSPASVGYMYNNISDVFNNSFYRTHYIQSNNTYSYGDNYAKNIDGTYSIDSATTISGEEWSSVYESLSNKYLCINPTNDKCDEIMYINFAANNRIDYYSTSYTYKYGESFIYSNGTYILNGDTKDIWNIRDEGFFEMLNIHHYTCWNDTGTCNTISYIYEKDGGLYYTNLSNGEGINDLLRSMLYSDETNKHNSIVKSLIESWYKQSLLQYTNKLEDTVYCNARNITNLGGWNQSDGNINTTLQFKNYNYTTDLSCLNETDQFTLGNNKAKLVYPISMIMVEEWYNFYNPDIMKTGALFWTISPDYSSNRTSSIHMVSNWGTLGSSSVKDIDGVRPAITLASFNTISSGTGSETDPWIIDD